MFNNHELYKYGFLSCANCIHKKGDNDCKRGYRTCSFEPVNWNLYIQVVLNNLKLSNIPATKTDKLIRSNKGEGYLDDLVQDAFYVELVNDCIWLLRHNQIAYCFSLSQLIDILKYVPDLQCTYDRSSNCFTLFMKS